MLSVKPFGESPQTGPVELYRLENRQGLQLDVCSYGATIVGLHVPDRDGERADVVLGYDNLPAYLTHTAYMGSVIGRVGNRIGASGFGIDGHQYRLACNWQGNEAACHLHGGERGFDKKMWAVEPDQSNQTLRLSYRSVDGEEGYPGNLDVQVRYQLSDDNELMIDYQASADRATPVNLTNHSYFNLAGNGANVLAHEVWLNADHYLPVTAGMIPTGELAPVQDTAFDFSQPRTLSTVLDDAAASGPGAQHPQLGLAGGYDHCFVTPESLIARVRDPNSGRSMTVYSTAPGVQLYSGQHLGDPIVGKHGRPYQPFAGLCLETQGFPDAVNHAHFPSVIVRPERPFQSRTCYQFRVDS